MEKESQPFETTMTTFLVCSLILIHQSMQQVNIGAPGISVGVNLTPSTTTSTNSAETSATSKCSQCPPAHAGLCERYICTQNGSNGEHVCQFDAFESHGTTCRPTGDPCQHGDGKCDGESAVCHCQNENEEDTTTATTMTTAFFPTTDTPSSNSDNVNVVESTTPPTSTSTSGSSSDTITTNSVSQLTDPLGTDAETQPTTTADPDRDVSALTSSLISIPNSDADASFPTDPSDPPVSDDSSENMLVPVVEPDSDSDELLQSSNLMEILPPWAFALIGVGALLFLLAVVAAVVFVVRRQNKKHPKEKNSVDYDVPPPQVQVQPLSLDTSTLPIESSVYGSAPALPSTGYGLAPPPGALYDEVPPLTTNLTQLHYDSPTQALKF
jgi:hypothetical protein